MPEATLTQLINKPTGQQEEAPTPTTTTPTPAAPVQLSGQQIMSILSNPNIANDLKAKLTNIVSYIRKQGEGKKFLGIEYEKGSSKAQQMGMLNYLINQDTGLRDLFTIPPEATQGSPGAGGIAPAEVSQIIEKAKASPGLSWAQGLSVRTPDTIGRKDAATPAAQEQGQAQSAFGPVSRTLGQGPVAEASTRGFQFGGTQEEAAPLLQGAGDIKSRYDEIFSKYRKLPIVQTTNNKPLGVADVNTEGYQLTPLA